MHIALSYDDGSRVRIHLHPDDDTTLRDSLVTLFRAYFDSPLLVQDSFYIGFILFVIQPIKGKNILNPQDSLNVVLVLFVVKCTIFRRHIPT